MAAGYFTEGAVPDAERLEDDQGPRLVTATVRRRERPGTPATRAALASSGSHATTSRAARSARSRALRERARAADAGRSRISRRPHAARRVRRRVVAEVTRAALSRRSRSRTTAAGATSRRAASTARARARRARSPAATRARRGARARRPRGRQRAARRRRGRALAYVERETGDALRALRGARRRELPRVHGGRVLVAARAIRCAPTRAALGVDRRADARARVPGERRQPAGRARGPRVAAAPARRGAARDADRLRTPCAGALLDARAATSPAAPTILRALLDALGAIWPRRWRSTASRSATSGAHPHAGGARRDGGLRAVPQAVAVARLLAARAARAGRRRGRRTRRADRRWPSTATAACCSTPACCALRDAGRRDAPPRRRQRARRRVARADRGAARRARRRSCARALGRPDLPLACILEGGTWAAGRELAQRAPRRRAAARRSTATAPCSESATSDAECAMPACQPTSRLDHPLVQHKLTLLRKKETSTTIVPPAAHRDRHAAGLRGDARRCRCTRSRSRRRSRR